MVKNEYTYNFLQELLGDSKTPDYSEREQAALRGKIPMTAGIFQSCLKTCIAARNAVEFMDLFEQFPEHGEIWAAALRKVLDTVAELLGTPDIRIKKLSKEDIQVRWTAFRGRIKEEYGDEAANSLAEDIFSVS